ncbi:MAG: hypothetical protein H0W62_11205 [Chitinophagales bacterium]|nr:hypothetical protein [Chitinophagales bacterium]
MPGGVGDTTGKSILRLWLTADNGPSTNIDGHTVDIWRDRSGAQNDMSTIQGRQPRYLANAYKGHPGIQLMVAISIFS